MRIETEWFDNQFNVNLYGSAEEPFLTIRGCKIAKGPEGDFVSYPATKSEKSGKWWKHAKGSDAFNATVLKMAQESQPKQSAKVPSIKELDDETPF